MDAFGRVDWVLVGGWGELRKWWILGVYKF